MYRFIILFVLSIETIAQNNDEETAKWLLDLPNKEQNREKNGNQGINSKREQVFSLDPVQKTSDEPRKNIRETNLTEEPAFSLDPDKRVLDEYFDVLIPRPSTPRNPPDINVIRDVPKTNVSDADDLNLSNADTIINCTRSDNQPGVCVQYYQCDTDSGHVIADGSTLIDVRSREGDCPHYLQVCCVVNGIVEKSESPAISVPVPSVLNNDSKCGWNNPALNIFQSKNPNVADDSLYANYGDFPWMVAIMRNRNESEEWSKNDYLGGGSLIHPAIVITAAHKVQQYKAEQIKCRAGEWDTQTTYELFDHQERDVKKIVIHKDYFRASLYNNIAVVFLKSPYTVDGSPNINVACLGASLPKPGTMCYSMGWGANFRKKNEYAVILKKVRLPLVSSEKCQFLLQNTRLGSFFKLHESLMCAGGEAGVDTCRGDGGSSLVCPVETVGENIRYAVFGMVAYGIGCGDQDVPSVYVNIPYLKPWLDATIAEEGLSNTMYNY